MSGGPTELIDLFLEYMKTEKRRSPSTGKAYSVDLFHYSQYLAMQDKGLREVNSGEIMLYLISLQHDGYSRSTIARKAATLRSFYRWMVNGHRVSVNPMLNVPPIKHSLTAPKVLTRCQILLLMAKPDCTEILGARDRAIMELLYATGLNISDLLALDYGSVSMRTHEITVEGRKDRVYLENEPHTALLRYLHLRELTVPEHYALFLNRHGTRLSDRSIRRKITAYAEKAGLRNVSPHTLRNSFAAHRLKVGVSLKTVQAAMGHNSAYTTKRYAVAS